MKKLERTISARVAAWVERKARKYAGPRCQRDFHQPKVPKALRET